jgi:DNA-binding winged helix-turn-helix (wHTH) protein
MRFLWPEGMVEESNLTRNISTLRKALGTQAGDPKYIETIPWRGYRFVADVREVCDENGGLTEPQRSYSKLTIED